MFRVRARNSFRLTLCGNCQRLFEGSVYSLARLDAPKKCTCEHCNKTATCIICQIDELEETAEKPERSEAHTGRELGAR